MTISYGYSPPWPTFYLLLPTIADLGTVKKSPLVTGDCVCYCDCGTVHGACIHSLMAHVGVMKFAWKLLGNGQCLKMDKDLVTVY
jgi:hypothetical protein